MAPEGKVGRGRAGLFSAGMEVDHASRPRLDGPKRPLWLPGGSASQQAVVGTGGKSQLYLGIHRFYSVCRGSWLYYWMWLSESRGLVSLLVFIPLTCTLYCLFLCR